MRSKSKVPEEEKLALLPPCTICSAKSSGLHFGVNTCEACKAFFRRCLNRRKETPLMCIGTGDCVVDITVKTLCSACRYDKCLKNGMSKSAIKTGRYSLERKADLIRDAIAKKGAASSETNYESRATASPEVPPSSDEEMITETSGVTDAFSQCTVSDITALSMNDPVASNCQPLDVPPNGLELLASIAPNLPPAATSCPRSMSSPALAAILRGTPNPHTAAPINGASNSSFSGDLQPIHHMPEISTLGFSPLTPASSPKELNVLSPKSISTSGPHNACAPFAPGKHKVNSTDASVSTMNDLDYIIQQVAAAYERYCPYTKEMKAKIVENQAQYKEEQEFFKDLFGPMKPLALEEYMEIYSHTGIDVDGRKEFATKFFGHIDQMIQNLIGFVKCIPGFTDINIDDQIELIRGGSIDWFIIITASGVNVENQLVTSFFGLTFSRVEFMKLHDQEIPDVFFEMAKLVQELKLDDTGLALIAAVCITDPEQQAFYIKNKEEVANVQYSLIEALNLYLSRTYERHLIVFTRAMAVLTEFRKERVRIHHERQQAHCVCSKIGVFTTPLMNAIVEENILNNSKRPLVQAVMNDREHGGQIVNCQENESTQMQL